MNPLKSILKMIIPPKIRHAIKYALSENYRDRQSWAQDREIGNKVFDLTGGRVVAGPFAELKYVSSARGSSIGPKLLGTYELELRDVVGMPKVAIGQRRRVFLDGFRVHGRIARDLVGHRERLRL